MDDFEKIADYNFYKKKKAAEAKAHSYKKKQKKHKKKQDNDAGPWKPGKPGSMAMARAQADGFFPAAMLLYWIKWRWKKKNKVQRNGKEWVVSSAEFWAKEAGLSESEYKNCALPVLKRKNLIDVKTWKFAGKRATWIHFNQDMLLNEFDDQFSFYEMRRQSDFAQFGITDGNKSDYTKKKCNVKKKKKG